MALVQQTARLLDADFDIEVVEMHHRHKVDAPSGTALGLGRAAAKGRGVELDAVAERGRDGITGARQPGAIGAPTKPLGRTTPSLGSSLYFAGGCATTRSFSM